MTQWNWLTIEISQLKCVSWCCRALSHNASLWQKCRHDTNDDVIHYFWMIVPTMHWLLPVPCAVAYGCNAFRDYNAFQRAMGVETISRIESSHVCMNWNLLTKMSRSTLRMMMVTSSPWMSNSWTALTFYMGLSRQVTSPHEAAVHLSTYSRRLHKINSSDSGNRCRVVHPFWAIFSASRARHHAIVVRSSQRGRLDHAWLVDQVG